MENSISGQLNFAGHEEIPENKTFTVTVDFTVDLDEIGEDAKKVNLTGEELEEHSSNVDEQLQAFWIKTDIELVDVVMEDLEDSLDDVGMKMKAVNFRRTG